MSKDIITGSSKTRITISYDIEGDTNPEDVGNFIGHLRQLANGTQDMSVNEVAAEQITEQLEVVKRDEVREPLTIELS